MFRNLNAGLLFLCSGMLAFAQPSEPEAASALKASTETIQAVAATNHGPSLVAYCSICAGLVSSTGNLYFTNFGINEFGPNSAGFYRTGKYSAPGTEILLYSESLSEYFNFGNVVWVYAGGTYYGYFVANYEQGNTRISQIKRVPLVGGAAAILAQSPQYIGVGDLATDGTNLYWVDGGGIRSMSIWGGAVHTLLSSTAVSHMALDPNNVYYSEGARISRVPKGGGAATTVFNATANVTALYAWSATSFYSIIFWGEHGGAVHSYSTLGGSYFTWQNPIAGRDVSSVGYDGSRALWIDCAEPGNTQCNLRIQSGGVTPTVVNAGVGSGHLQWDSASAYWIGVPGIQRYVY